MRATIWSFTWRLLRPYFEGSTGYQLTAGLKVLLLVSVEFHQQYSISLNIKDIDPNYTLGDLEKKKAEILERLQQEGVIDMNKELEIPPVIQRIAVISSETAAGYGDFLNTLLANSQNLRFDLTLFPAVMQGDNAGKSLMAALDKIFCVEDKFDMVVIIRGGGARIELECFNDFDLAYHITQFPLPVITGIGHERDDTITDRVACLKLKTPTAVAEYIIDRNENFLTKIENYQAFILDFTRQKISEEKVRLSRLSNLLAMSSKNVLRKGEKNLNTVLLKLNSGANQLLSKAYGKLTQYDYRLKLQSREKIQSNRLKLNSMTEVMKKSLLVNIQKHKERLSNHEKLVQLYHPDKVLARGYSVTYYKGKVVKNAAIIQSGEEIESLLYKGKIISKIISDGKKN